jgi:hypothetical protein
VFLAAEGEMGAPDWSRRRSTPGGIDLRKRKFAFASQKFRLRRRCRSYFLVHFSFPIFKISSQAQAVSQFPFTALLVVATGAHTQPKATPGKKVCFRFAKIFAFGDGVFLEVIF